MVPLHGGPTFATTGWTFGRLGLYGASTNVSGWQLAGLDHDGSLNSQPIPLWLTAATLICIASPGLYVARSVATLNPSCEAVHHVKAGGDDDGAAVDGGVDLFAGGGR